MAKKKAVCQECGGTEDVQLGICEDCSPDFTWCNCCKEWQRQDGDTCRHIFWTEDGWAGAGSDGDVEPDEFKEPFFTFLDILGDLEPKDTCCYRYLDMITWLQAEISKHAFWTFTIGPMIGGLPELNFRRADPELSKDGKIIGYTYASVSGYVLERHPRYKDAGDGFAWLQSLCATDTKKANRLTVKWIKEWRKRRREEKKPSGAKTSSTET
jgi:hypothetical protein